MIDRRHQVDDDDRGSVVLAIVREFVHDLHPTEPAVPVRRSSRLDRDLGLSSVELSELLARLENTQGILLGPTVLGSAETVDDLVAAVAGALPASRPAGPTPSAPVAVDVDEVPTDARTLVEVLEWHCDRHADRLHVRVLGESGVEAELDYGTLHDRAQRAAAGLLASGLRPGQAVALMLSDSPAYFVCFLGAVLAGAIPVPIYPPIRSAQLEDHLVRQVPLLANADALVLVTDIAVGETARLLRTRLPGLLVVSPDGLSVSVVSRPPAPCRREDVALLQYTSGSTGNPKGVELTHANLLANIRAMGEAARVSPTDVFVSWLPLYHDMGLIGAWLGSLYFGMPLVVMSPLTFLSRPGRWLEAIDEYRGTLSAAPNFGYELCVRRISDAEIAQLDLSSWRVAFNGSEPVSPDTITRFRDRFAPCGLRRESITPVYGLAEACVGLAFPPLGRGFVIDSIDRELFTSTGRARPAAGDPTSLRFVACGRPLAGHDIRVVDGKGRPLGDRREGRIEFRGPSATRGYHSNPEATRTLFHEDWLDTGDLGYLADGDLYVTGRAKDLIIRAGRNVHPEPLEEAIGKLARIRPGCVAAFASPDERTGTERLVVVAETRDTDPQQHPELRAEVVEATVDVLGTPPDDVVLVPAHSIPKTSSGKLRRAATRELFERGAFAVGGQLPRPTPRFRTGVRERAHRLGSAVLALCYAMYGWSILATVGLSLWLVMVVVPRARWRRVVVAAAARCAVSLSGTSLSVDGRERAIAAQPCIVVANHPSWLDALVLTAVLPPSFTFVAGEEFRQGMLTGLILRRAGTQFVERRDREQGVADTGQLVALARAGHSLVFFPEGGVAPLPELGPFRMGAFVAAAQAGRPVVPVTICGTRSMLPPGRRFLRRGCVEVMVGEPIPATDAGWSSAIELRSRARDAILRAAPSDSAHR